MTPALYSIPVTLGETEINQVLPAYNHDIVALLNLIPGTCFGLTAGAAIVVGSIESTFTTDILESA